MIQIDIISCVLDALLACTEQTQALQPRTPTTLTSHARTVEGTNVCPKNGILLPFARRSTILLQLYEELQSVFWSRIVIKMSLVAKVCQTLVAHVALTNTGVSLCASPGLAIVK